MSVGYLKDDLEWKLIQAFCNRVLQWGLERERLAIEESMIKSKKTRQRIAARNRVDKAYRELWEYKWQ